jgi:hypothetical protein
VAELALAAALVEGLHDHALAARIAAAQHNHHLSALDDAHPAQHYGAKARSRLQDAIHHISLRIR